jgi:drug/metabolite transporter (DMT)-like permease
MKAAQEAAAPREGERAASVNSVWAALVTVWIVWGSTYLAIRVAVRTIPPLMMGSIRFLLAGGILYLFAVRRGDRAGDRPTATHWRSAFIIGTALLLGGNGLVGYAEQRVPSGIAALLIATVPLWLAIGDRLRYGTRLSWQTVLGLAIGFGGVILLVGQSGAGKIDSLGAAALVAASLFWAAGSLYSRGAPLPRRPLVGTGMEMIAGGLVLAVVSVATGELGRLDLNSVSGESVLGLIYLIVFGSWVGFTAYIWLLRNARTSLVGTYAFVNPVVAVLLGWWLLGETITARTALAGGVIVVGVALIVTATRPQRSGDAVAGEPCAGCPPVSRSSVIRRALRAMRRPEPETTSS